MRETSMYSNGLDYMVSYYISYLNSKQIFINPIHNIITIAISKGITIEY